MEIYNFKKVSDLLACAGQPREGQLPALADDGFSVIVNLGLTDGKYALKDEASSVQALGIQYHHIPVLFDDPKSEELEKFLSVMQPHQADKTLVHCAANYRASVFTGLYLFATGKMSETDMRNFIEDVWQPDEVWEQFIDESLELLRKKP
jgi:protein tyrosine phosphatase (PTP) superfamily phosphohydrolase (DUF442 family)